MFHGHTPWIVILVRKVAEWKEKHGGAMPDGKQRGEFKARWDLFFFSFFYCVILTSLCGNIRGRWWFLF